MDELPSVLTEGSITLTDAAAILSVDPVTVWRWITAGYKVVPRRTVKLEAVRVGRAWRTSKPAVARFLSATQGGEPSDGPGVGRDAMDKRGQAALDRLRQKGILK